MILQKMYILGEIIILNEQVRYMICAQNSKYGPAGAFYHLFYLLFSSSNIQTNNHKYISDNQLANYIILFYVHLESCYISSIYSVIMIVILFGHEMPRTFRSCRILLAGDCDRSIMIISNLVYFQMCVQFSTDHHTYLLQQQNLVFRRLYIIIC